MDGTKGRPRVYFNEYNPFIGSAAYLPLVSGKLHSFAVTDPDVRDHYRWMPYLFRIQSPDEILAAYDRPAVVAFSAAIWNEQLCLEVVRRLKARWPQCVVIFGGSQVPHDPRRFLREHPEIDVTVTGEGEDPFLAVMRRLMTTRDLSGIDRVGWRDGSGEIVVNPDAGRFERDLDVYPSPFLEGMYDELIAAHPEIRFQVIIETNRGCPFHCTFCYWGKGGLSRKYRYFGPERVEAELDWIGRNKITFVYNADSNFGMHRRDEDIAHHMVAVKKRFGYPEKVVNLYGKNTDERIFRIAKLLHENGLHKGIGLSRQSLDPEALARTKRANISLEVYESLQRQFEAAGIPVFSELIIALPGETYESFANGIAVLLEKSVVTQLIIVLCELYPNTEMAEPEYMARYGMVGRRNVNYGVHSRVHESGLVAEYIDYVVATDTMPVEDWRRTGILSWTTMTMIGLRVAADLFVYLRRELGVPMIDVLRFMAEGDFPAGRFPLWRRELAAYEAFMDQILAGLGRGVVEPEFGGIYWAVEEASFLRIADRADDFYAELLDMLGLFLGRVGIAHDGGQLAQVVRYQRMRLPTPVMPATLEYDFGFSIPAYFAALARQDQAACLHATPQRMAVTPEDFAGDRVRFAQEKLLWARRGGKFNVEFSWYDTATHPVAVLASVQGTA